MQILSIHMGIDIEHKLKNEHWDQHKGNTIDKKDLHFLETPYYFIFQDPSHSLHDMVVKCIKATEQLDDRVLNTLTKEVQEMFTQVDNPSMKEVKGIEDRLYGLDQILSSGKRVVQEQGDMAQVSIRYRWLGLSEINKLFVSDL